MITNLVELYGELERIKNVVATSQSQIGSWDVDVNVVMDVVTSLLSEWETSDLSNTYVEFNFNDKSTNKFKYIKVLFRNLELYLSRMRSSIKPEKYIPEIQETLVEIFNAINYVQTSISQNVSDDVFSNTIVKKQFDHLIEWFRNIKERLLAVAEYEFIDEYYVLLTKRDRNNIVKFVNYLYMFIQHFNLNIASDTVALYTEPILMEQRLTEYKQNVDKFLEFVELILTQIREEINNTV
jgi:hypothetical protein